MTDIFYSLRNPKKSMARHFIKEDLIKIYLPPLWDYAEQKADNFVCDLIVFHLVELFCLMGRQNGKFKNKCRHHHYGEINFHCGPEAMAIFMLAHIRIFNNELDFFE